MTKTSIKSTVVKSAKVGGATVSLLWSTLGCIGIVYGATMVMREKTGKLVDAIRA